MPKKQQENQKNYNSRQVAIVKWRALDSETRTTTSTRFSQYCVSIAYARTSVILARKRDRRRHSITSFRENVGNKLSK